MTGIIGFICILIGFALGIFVGCAFAINKDEEDEYFGKENEK